MEISSNELVTEVIVDYHHKNIEDSTITRDCCGPSSTVWSPEAQGRPQQWSPPGGPRRGPLPPLAWVGPGVHLRKRAYHKGCFEPPYPTPTKTAPDGTSAAPPQRRRQHTFPIPDSPLTTTTLLHGHSPSTAYRMLPSITVVEAQGRQVVPLLGADIVVARPLGTAPPVPDGEDP